MMIRLFAVFLIMSLLFPSVSYAADIPVDSQIKAVTVYNNRAKVIREAVVDVPEGDSEIVFKNLPAILLPDSLRVEGSSTADIKFGAVMHKHVMEVDLTSERERELNAELETLQDKRKYIEAEKRALMAQKTFLENIGKQATLRTNEAIAELNLQPEQWISAAQTLKTNILDISKADLDKQVALRELDHKIQQIRNELNQSRTGSRSTYDVRVPLDSAAKTKLTVKLSYQVPNASWQPIYDARLGTEDEKLEIVQYGSVRQTTGEDWTGVKLSLSTAQPHRGTSLPDLQPYWVNIFDPEMSTLQKSRGSGMGGSASFSAISSNVMPTMERLEVDAMMDGDRAFEEAEKKEASFVTADIETGGFVSEYKISGAVSVLSNGSETKLMVGDFDTESHLEIHVKPQLSTEAFLVARTKLKGESPILPGKLSLFRDGAYVGQTHLPLLRPEGEHALFFGVDDKVSVKRKTLKDEHKAGGVIVRSDSHERHYVTEIENLHKMPVRLIVKETVPAGRDKKIETEILEKYTTQGYLADAANIKGMLRWDIELAAKQKKDIELGWKVTWPKDQTLSGL